MLFNNNKFNDWENNLLTEQEKIELAKRRKARNRIIAIVAAALFVVAVGVGLYFLLSSGGGDSSSEEGTTDKDKRIEELEQQLAMEQNRNDMLQLTNSMDSVDAMYNNLTEGQIQIIRNDSILEKYQAARAEIEKLMKQLNDEQNRNRRNNEEIAKLKAQIETLQGICRDYLRQINELTEKNQQLEQENSSLKQQNENLGNQVRETRKQNDNLNERMTLAEKLNVTGVNLVALNSKGKTEKKIEKAKKLMVTFSIPANVSTPPGEKTIYLRIISPEGQLLTGNVGSFPFEGSSLPATARLNVDYANEEIGGLQIFWDVNSTLNKGEYLVELFADGYRLYSGRFNKDK